MNRAAWPMVLCAGALAVAGALGSPRVAGLDASDPLAGLVLRNFDPFRGDIGARPGLDGQARFRVGGFAPSAAVDLTLVLSARAPRSVEFEDPVRIVGQADVGPSPRSLRAHAEADALGVADFTFRASPDEIEPAALRVHRIEASAREGSGPGLAVGSAILTVAVAILSTLWLGPARALAPALGLILALALGIHVNRLVAFPIAGLGLLLLGLAALARGGAAALSAYLGIPKRASIVLAWAMLLKIAFALNDPGADFDFHLNNVGRWRAGDTLTSTAPGLERPLRVPYPPALYAIVASGGNDRAFLRFAMIVLELSGPFLVLAVALSSGLSPEVSADAAAAAAAMPEGLVVLAKGVAANMAGQTATMLTVLSLLKGSYIGFALSLSLVFLSHLGASLAILPLLAAWAFLVPRIARPGTTRVRMAAGLAVALALAWFAYYRDVLPLVAEATLRTTSSITGSAWGYHPIRLGKIAQAVVLEGALLPVLAIAGWRRSPVPMRAWFAAAGGEGLLAAFSPLMLRFEYFAVPAVAILAAIAASGGERQQRCFRVLLILGLILQAALALGFHTGVFPIINVVLESPRWPLFGVAGG